MTYVRTTPGAGGDRRHHHYECKRCIVVYTELDHGGELAAERARKLNKEPIRTLQ